MHKRFHPTVWLGVTLLAIGGLGLAQAPAKSDPLKGTQPGVTIESTTPKLKEGTVGIQPKAVNLKRLCSWKEYPIEGFPKSGFCRWTDGARLNTPCSCIKTVEHAKEEHEGIVIEGPASGGPSSPVR